jgi:hypothetical protein
MGLILPSDISLAIGRLFAGMESNLTILPTSRKQVRHMRIAYPEVVTVSISHTTRPASYRYLPLAIFMVFIALYEFARFLSGRLFSSLKQRLCIISTRLTISKPVITK